MHKPFIAITQRFVQADHGEMRECLASDWGEFFAQNLPQYLPLPLAYSIPFARYAPCVQGVILSGGNDLECFCDDALSHIRDRYERSILGYCVEERIPVLGICRGAQILAQYFGSTIHACKGHIGSHIIHAQGHTYKVNSFHNYGIREIAPDLTPIAVAQDGSIEAFQHSSLPIFAMMWHIERSDGMHYINVWQSFLQAIKEQNR